MSAHVCGAAQHALERAFVESDPAAIASLRVEIGDCAACRSIYDALLGAEALLATPAPFGPLERASILERALPATTSAEHVAASAGAEPKRSRSRWRRLLPALSAALAACVAIAAAVVLTRADGPSGVGGSAGRFAVRGTGSADSNDTSAARAGVRALCMRTSDGGQLSVRSLGTTAAPPSRCSRRDRLGFSAFNRGERSRHLSIFVVGPRGRVIDAYASSGDEALPARSGERPLDVGVRLDALRAGTIRIVALLTDKPTTPEQRQAVAAQLRDGRPLDELTPTGGSVYRAAVNISE